MSWSTQRATFPTESGTRIVRRLNEPFTRFAEIESPVAVHASATRSVDYFVKNLGLITGRQRLNRNLAGRWTRPRCFFLAVAAARGVAAVAAVGPRDRQNE